MKQNIAIISDIHSCANELDGLLDQLGFSYNEFTKKWSHPTGKTIVQCGDAFDRGPEPVRTFLMIQSLISSGVWESILGNHCWKLLKYYKKKFSGEKIDMKLSNGLKGTIEAFEEAGMEQEVKSWLETLPIYIRKGTVLVTHGAWIEGCSPGKLQSFCLYGQTTGKKTSEGYPERSDQWKFDYDGDLTHIVVGHSIFPEPQIIYSRSGTQVLSIDLGCYKGGSLCAYSLPEEYFYFEKAERVYHD